MPHERHFLISQRLNKKDYIIFGMDLVLALAAYFKIVLSDWNRCLNAYVMTMYVTNSRMDSHFGLFEDVGVYVSVQWLVCKHITAIEYRGHITLLQAVFTFVKAQWFLCLLDRVSTQSEQRNITDRKGASLMPLGRMSRLVSSAGHLGCTLTPWAQQATLGHDISTHT